MRCAATLGHATPKAKTLDLEGMLSSTYNKILPENYAAREIASVIILLKLKILKGILMNWTFLKLPLYQTFLSVRTYTH